VTNIESCKAAAPKPWGIIATALWALLPGLILPVMAFVAGVVLALRTGGTGTHVPTGDMVSFLILVSTVVQVPVLAWVARHRGWQAADYLGWIVPNPRDAAVAFVVIGALILASAALRYLLGRDLSPSQINTYRSALEAGWLVPLWIALVVAAPLNEELLFRGFLYRGWARSSRAVVPAVVIISALWAILHLPDYRYDWFIVLVIFLNGLVLGWARWRSGSTMLTFAMHAFINTWAMAVTTVKVHWFT
jgi:membrane protease YdiL (CAAX protease family)